MQPLFNPLRLAGNRRRVKSADGLFLHRRVADMLRDRFKDVSYQFDKTIIIGDHAEHFFAPADGMEFYNGGDIEALRMPLQQAGRIVGFLCQHKVEDLPVHLLRIRQALCPDGLFIGAMFGGETLFQLRHVLSETEARIHGGVRPHVHPFADKQQIGALLQRAGFALPVIDSEIFSVSYPDIFALMRDLRGMGEGYALSERPGHYSRGFFAAADAHYRKAFPDPEMTGRILASFEVIFMLGWSPHESQQKPLRPGSASVSLKEVL